MSIGQSQITQIRLPSGKLVSIVDWTDRPLFSTMDLLSGFTDVEIDAFTYIVSDQVASSQNITTRRVASERDTNISTPGGMASTEEMLIYNIKVEPNQFLADTGTPGDASLWTMGGAANQGSPIPESQNLSILGWFSLLRLEISQKIYAEAGLNYFQTGFGPYTASAVAGATPIAASAGKLLGSMGFPSAEAVRSFVIPHHIGGPETYRVTLTVPNGTFGADGNGVHFRTFATPAASATTTVLSLRLLLEGLYKRPVS